AVLYPLEIRNRDAASVGQDVGDDEDPLFGEDFVSQWSGRAVGAFAKDFAAKAVGVFGRDHVLGGGREKYIAFQEQGVGFGHVLAAGKTSHGAGFLAVLLQGGDIQSPRIVDRAVIFHDGDDLES